MRENFKKMDCRAKSLSKLNMISFLSKLINLFKFSNLQTNILDNFILNRLNFLNLHSGYQTHIYI